MVLLYDQLLCIIHFNECLQEDEVCPEPQSYSHLYKYSISDMEKFWAVRARKVLVWDEPFTTVLKWNQNGGVSWFTGGKLNVTSMYSAA